jgi:hypothetical protein
VPDIDLGKSFARVFGKGQFQYPGVACEFDTEESKRGFA